jgi:2'-5' RNA ligase
VRAFFAVELPDLARGALSELAQSLREAAPEAPVRWVEPEGYHLTLRFLGEVDDPSPVVAHVETALAGVGPLSATLGAPGSFGSGSRLRVVWVALSAPGLDELARSVEEGCRRAGFPPEARPFRAHVTLGRVRRGKGGRATRGLVDAIKVGAAPAIDAFPVEQVVLFESTLERGRPPVYTPVSRLTLGEPDGA